MLRDINVISNGTGQETPYASSWSSTYESVGPLPTFHSFSPPVGFGLGFVVVLSCFVSFLQVSWNFSILRAF